MRRTVLDSAYRLFPILSSLTVITVIALPQSVRSQSLVLGGVWAHVSGYSGTNGFNVGADWWFTKRVTLAADYDETPR